MWANEAFSVCALTLCLKGIITASVIMYSVLSLRLRVICTFDLQSESGVGKGGWSMIALAQFCGSGHSAGLTVCVLYSRKTTPTLR